MTFSEPVTVDLTDGTATLGLVVAGQERSLAKCGSLKKALTWCANEKRTPAERAQHEQQKLGGN